MVISPRVRVEIVRSGLVCPNAPVAVRSSYNCRNFWSAAYPVQVPIQNVKNILFCAEIDRKMANGSISHGILLKNRRSKSMLYRNDQRKTDRYEACTSLTYRLSLAGKNYHAKALNHSDNGISFENRFVLKPGTIVCLKRENCPGKCSSIAACDCCRTITFATVKWCKKREEIGVEQFAVGAEYIQHFWGY